MEQLMVDTTNMASLQRKRKRDKDRASLNKKDQKKKTKNKKRMDLTNISEKKVQLGNNKNYKYPFRTGLKMIEDQSNKMGTLKRCLYQYHGRNPKDHFHTLMGHNLQVFHSLSDIVKRISECSTPLIEMDELREPSYYLSEIQLFRDNLDIYRSNSTFTEVLNQWAPIPWVRLSFGNNPHYLMFELISICSIAIKMCSRIQIWLDSVALYKEVSIYFPIYLGITLSHVMYYLALYRAKVCKKDDKNQYNVWNGSLIQFGAVMLRISTNIEECKLSMNILSKDLPVVSTMETAPYQSMLDDFMGDDPTMSDSMDYYNTNLDAFTPYYRSPHSDHMEVDQHVFCSDVEPEVFMRSRPYSPLGIKQEPTDAMDFLQP